MCVVDTIAPGGMMTIGAIAVSADTVVLQPEGRVSVHQMLAGPKVVSESKWITAGRPINLVSGDRLRYTRSGTPKVFAPGSIALLGVFRGTPIFTAAKLQGRMRAEIESLSARGIDLERALQQRSNLRREAEKITDLYIPTTLAGCQFQQFRRIPPPRRR